MLSLLSIIAFYTLFLHGASAQSIYAVPMPVNWPVAMAAVIPPSMKLSTNPTFTWTFPNDKGPPVCTVQGQAKVSCKGKVLDHVFRQAGTQTISLMITDSTLPQPKIISVTIEIKDVSSYPVVGRAEIRNVQDETWRKYVEALYILKQVGIYDHFALIHTYTFGQGRVSGTRRNAAHAGPAFIAWHRAQVRVLELMVQYAIGDSSIGVPYWDWMKGYDGMERYFGPSGDKSHDGVVSSGPFCNDPRQTDLVKCPKKWPLPADYPHPDKAIQRDFGNDTRYHFQTQQEYDRLMSIPTFDAAPYDDKATAPTSFRSALEGWPPTEQSDFSYGFNHNGIHRWVAGTMGKVELSLHDPIFFAHHSNNDRMSTVWQVKHGCDDGKSGPVCYPLVPSDPALQRGGIAGVVNGRLPGHMYDDTMFPWDLKISDLLVPNVGYKYLDTTVKPDPINPTSQVVHPDIENSNDGAIIAPAFIRKNSAADSPKSSVLCRILVSVIVAFVSF